MAVIDKQARKEAGDARCPNCGGRVEGKGRDADGRLILMCSSCGSISIVKKAESRDE